MRVQRLIEMPIRKGGYPTGTASAVVNGWGKVESLRCLSPEGEPLQHILSDGQVRQLISELESLAN